MGLQLEEFRAVGESKNREDAIQRFTTLRNKFKEGFRRMIVPLHPDHNEGDPKKTEQFHLLIAMAKEFESLKIKTPSATKTTQGDDHC